MKRLVWGLLIATVVIAAAVTIVALPRGSEWTTVSSEALEAFQAGMEAQGKLYHRDAARHYERALELDPDFVAARLELAAMISEDDSERAEQLRKEALAADRTRLTPRERLMLDRLAAHRDKDSARADALVDEFLERYPDDPHALALKAGRLFRTGHLEEALRAYQRMVEVDPNWVLSYNQLGYIAMQMSRFAEAEEYFTSYRFIAPDQANPHDSLGELFVILGRYDEAAASFERAIAIKSDFWNSYVHLMIVHILQKDFEAADRVVEQALAAEALGESAAEALRCSLKCWRAMEDGAWGDLIELHQNDPSCLDNPMAFGTTAAAVHRAASVLGLYDQAIELEDRVEKMATKYKGALGTSADSSAGLLHMRGVRLACQGELKAAEDLLREADGHLRYKNADLGLFKLLNRLVLVEVLLARGHQADAHSLLSQVRTVNPTLASDFEADGLEVLGLRGR